MGRDLIMSETLDQLGGTGLRGALVYMGVKHIVKGRDYVSLHVNGKRGEHWVITITLDFSDAYTVELTATKGGKVTSLAKQEDVYCDELQSVVEGMYDAAIKQHNGGTIPGVGIIGRGI